MGCTLVGARAPAPGHHLVGSRCRPVSSGFGARQGRAGHRTLTRLPAPGNPLWSGSDGSCFRPARSRGLTGPASLSCAVSLCHQDSEAPSTSPSRSGSGTVTASTAGSARCRWWAAASSPRGTTSCAPTAGRTSEAHASLLATQIPSSLGRPRRLGPTGHEPFLSCSSVMLTLFTLPSFVLV